MHPFNFGGRTIFCRFWPIFFLLSTFLAAQWPPPPPNNDNWEFLQANANGPLSMSIKTAAVAPNGDIYVAGLFGNFGNQVIGVVRWDGSCWRPLGDHIEGFTSATTVVNCMAVASNGDVYLGGFFNESFNSPNSSVITKNIAKWNGATGQWEALGDGVNSTVNDIGIYENGAIYEVYLGGVFGEAVDPNGAVIQTRNAALWDAAAGNWQALGDGLDNTVSALAVDNQGRPHFAGSFNNAFNAPGQSLAVNGAAYWTGNAWAAMGEGLAAPGGFRGIKDIDADLAGNIYLSGNVDGINPGGIIVPGPVLQWDGSQWLSVSAGLGVVESAGHLAIDGQGQLYFYYVTLPFSIVLDRYDGANWTRIGDFGNEFLAAIDAHPQAVNGSLYAGGFFTEVINPPNPPRQIRNHARWDGQQWQRLECRGGANGGIYAITEGPSGNNFPFFGAHYVGGRFSTFNGIFAENIVAIVDDEYQPLAGGVNNTVNSISSDGPGIFAGGTFTSADNDDGSPPITVNHLAYWFPQTQRWSAIAGGTNGTVEKIAHAFGQLYIGGAFSEVINSDGSRVTANGFAVYDVSQDLWLPFGNGLFSGAGNPVVYAFTFDRGLLPEQLILGGGFEGGINFDGSQVVSPNLIIWDFSSNRWLPFEQGMNDSVYALYNHESRFGKNLYIGGAFSQPNGVAVNSPHFVVYDLLNNNWLPAAEGTDGAVRAIRTGGNGLLLGGDFTVGYYQNGSQFPLNHIGKFHFPETPLLGGWSGFADGVNGPVYDMMNIPPCIPSGEIILTGGEFTVAGNRGSRNIALWRYVWRPVQHVARNSGGGGGSGQTAVMYFGPCPAISTKMTEGYVIADSLDFRETAVFDTIGGNTIFSLEIFDNDNPGISLALFDSLQMSGDAGNVLMLNGVDNPGDYAPNPEGISTALSAVVAILPTEAPPGQAALLLNNAVTDAPAIDVVIQGGAVLVSGLSYNQTADSLFLPPDSYLLEVRRSSDGQLLNSFPLDLLQDEGKTVVLTLNGFLDPAANQNGPAMDLTRFNGNEPVVTGIDGDDMPPNIAEGFRLEQNYPNPFNPKTDIRYQISDIRFVTLTVYDLLGRQVKALVKGREQPGSYSIEWDGRNDSGQAVSSGVYFYRLAVDNRFSQTRKMLLIR